MTVIALPSVLINKLTDEGAKAIVDALDKTSEETKQITLQLAEERFEKRLAQLDAKIEKVQSNIIKWMFIFWAGQITILFAFFRK